MSNVGVMGLGKLGLILALVINRNGEHAVSGYDPSDRPWGILARSEPEPAEQGIDFLLTGHSVHRAETPEELVRTSDLIFVAVPTPHPPEYDGARPMPEITRDFNYGYLVQAVRSVCLASAKLTKPVTLAVVSTVLPGTVEKLLRPLLTPLVRLVYSPSLIALGTVVEDLLNPEMVIIGADSFEDAHDVMRLHSSLHSRPVQVMSIPSAELAKVAYNTFTSLKIVFANTLLEIADKTGADADEVTAALSVATDKLLSPKYLTGGVGGGGFCHPRDVNAMSWLADRLDLSSDVFGFLSAAREAQSQWLAEQVSEWAELTGMQIVVLGTAYKPESPLTGGSAALLLREQLRLMGHGVIAVDPYATPGEVNMADVAKVAAVYVIGCGHRIFREVVYAPGSVVIDPVGYIPDRPNVTVVRLGRKQ